LAQTEQNNEDRIAAVKQALEEKIAESE
jgi:hypothetical protein